MKEEAESPNMSWRYWFSVFISIGIPILFLAYTIIRQVYIYATGRGGRRRSSILLNEERRPSKLSHDFTASGVRPSRPVIITHKPSESSSRDEEEEEDGGDLTSSIKRRNFTIISTSEKTPVAVDPPPAGSNLIQNNGSATVDFAKVEAKRIVQSAIKRHQMVSEVKVMQPPPNRM